MGYMQERSLTIPEALFAASAKEGCEYVFHLEEGEVRLGSAELAERAVRGARRLLALGVEPGEAVGVLGPNRPEWIVSAFATWVAGAVLVPVQLPLRVRDPGAFREQLHNLIEAAGCRLVLADPSLAALLPQDVAVPWNDEGDESAEEPCSPALEDVAVIQFTSGSTAAPKGAQLSHAAVAAQMEALRKVYCYEDGGPRLIANWTPFFHDLGLFANAVQPAFSGATVHQLPTERFARDPAEWLRLVEATGAAVTVAPCSAFASALRVAARRGERIALGCLDVVFFAAESIDADIAARMVTTPGLGFRPEAIGGTYGLAEAVMAAAFPAAGEGLRVDRVSRGSLATAGIAVPAADGPLRALASCGQPVMDLRIRGERGEAPERQVGEIQVRGASLMSGYAGVDAPDPFEEGWLRTGDLGYLAEGDLFVTGRAKDVMIAMGHNYHPEDFEWAAARVDGVRPGRCVAFGLPDSEHVVVLVESSSGSAASDLERRVKDTVADVVGIAPSKIVVLPPGTVQKTTSGKLRRAAMREEYTNGALTGAGSR